MVRTARVLLVVLGVLGAGYGIRLLLEQGTDNLIAAGSWLIGGVVLHDGVIGPLTIGVAAAATLALRRKLPAPVIVGAIVLATVTLVAYPVLGRFGARPDNPTLLDRNYTVGWFVFAGLTLLAVAISLIRRHRQPVSEKCAG